MYNNIKFPPLPTNEEAKSLSRDDLVLSFMRTVFKVANSYSLESHDFEDLIGDVTLTLIEAVDRISQLEHDNIRGYLITVIVGAAKDFIRKKIKEETNYSLDHIKAKKHLDKLEFYEEMEALAKTDREKEVIKLRMFGCKDYEVAAILGLTHRQVKYVRKNLYERYKRNVRLV